MLFFENLVDASAQCLAVAVGAGAGVRRADDFECRDTGRSRERIGVECALMRDLLAVGSLGDLEVEQVEAFAAIQ